MKPNSRETLKEYCLRKLGSPVINIEVAEEQLEDCIDDAIQYMTERSYYDGTERALYKKLFSAEDIERMKSNQEVGDESSGSFFVQNNYIDLPDNVISVNGAYPIGFMASASPLSASYHVMLDMIYNLRYDGLLTYTMTREYLSLIQFLTSGNVVPIRYQRVNNRVYLDVDLNRYKDGMYMLLDCIVITEPTNPDRFWNDVFLKKYTTLLIKKQWGVNTSKFDGVQLPGGITLNGSKMYDEATREIEALFEDMSNSWQMPILDRVG